VPFDWDENNLWLGLDGRAPRREPTLTRPAHPSAVDDDHIFKWWELMEAREPWGYPFRLAREEQARFVNQIPT
jgi:hypothetical protein